MHVMNLIEDSRPEGSGRLVRQFALAGGAVALLAVAAAAFLDNAASTGFAGLIGDNTPKLSSLPRPVQTTSGIRYGNTDYMPTASIPASKQKIKNVVSDTSLGMPN